MKKPNRLSTTYEFNKTRRFGNRVPGRLFDVFYLLARNYDGPPRIGIVVSNRFSPVAPKRNYVKRIYREIITEVLKSELVPNGYWVVFHPKQPSLEAPYEEIRTQVNKVLSEISFSH